MSRWWARRPCGTWSARPRANEAASRARVRTVLRSSYSSHYRRGMLPLLVALNFRCNNSTYRPVMDALGLLARYAQVDGMVRFYDAGDDVPLEGVVPWALARRGRRRGRPDRTHPL